MEESKQKKNVKVIDNNNKQGVNLYEFYLTKLEYYNNAISNVIIDLEYKIKCKYLSHSDSIQCIKDCRDVYSKIDECYSFLNSDILKNMNDILVQTYLQDHIEKLQEINDMLNKIIKSYGCHSLEQLIVICFGNDYYSNLSKEENYKKHLLLTSYFHPTSFKCFTWKDDHKKNNQLSKNSIVEDNHIVESGETFDCFDNARRTRFYDQKANGIRVVYQNSYIRRTLIINGYLDIGIDIKCVKSEFIKETITSLFNNKAKDVDVNSKCYVNYVNMLSIKEHLVYNTNELFKNYIGVINQYELTKSKPLVQVVSEFMNMELYSQYKFIKTLLIYYHEPNAYYLCGILFNLLNDDNEGVINNADQNTLYEFMPFECKIRLRDIKNNYSEKISTYKKFNINKIPYEQRIDIMNVSDDVKEKAHLKLKEVMSKSEESGIKARNYLDGLLNIPFGVYKQEPLLKSKNEIETVYEELIRKLLEFVSFIKNNLLCNKNAEILYNNSLYLSFNKLLEKYIKSTSESGKNNDEKKTIVVCYNEAKNISDKLSNYINNIIIQYVKILCSEMSRGDVKNVIDEYNINIRSLKVKHKNEEYINLIKKINTTGKKKNEMLDDFLDIYSYNINLFDYNRLDVIEKLLTPVTFTDEIANVLRTIVEHITKLKNSMDGINKQREDAFKNIDECVYGHEPAKKQIKNIINQWITGENTGYCFGFEGPPGIGKTSMAKMGLSRCLKDIDGTYRPFDFIALGGSTNGSYLNGHSYTYLGSSWGRIVDILMSKKCMNPIIFIDELDKVSNSEYGKEIIGVLTHLVDSTQNSIYQDKYFSGINIDLSKALFVFSYNDPSRIDPILLDRIHRIKFDKLTPFDKVVICNSYIIPEMNKNYGFGGDFISISESTILYIIDNYTYESGVRKLKQLLFEVWGDINEMLLSGKIDGGVFMLDINYIDNVFLKEKHKISKITVRNEPSVGIINGLWANALGMGGLTPIQIKWYPCKTPLELKLTGMQGDVMKESMNVAKTVAWGMLSKEEVDIMWKFVSSEDGPSYGLHIHCPEGAVNKDGPSAGGAITTALLSMFKNKPISNTYAMTGEINLSGTITAIGGLEQKLYYGIRAGARVFAYPEENQKDYELFRERYKNKIDDFDTIVFYSVKCIDDVCKIVF
jgi:ATP-dependent Lon protease